MAGYHDSKARAAELVDYSLTDLAGIIIDLEEKVEALDDAIDDLTDQLAEARSGE